MIGCMTTLGKRVGQALEVSGLRPFDVDKRVAAALGKKTERSLTNLTAATIHKGRQPTADVLAAMAKVLGVSVSWLLGETDEPSGASAGRPSPEDPRPEVTAAIAFARANGVREDAIEDIASRFQRGGRKLTPEEWFHRMRSRSWEMDEEDAGRGTSTLTPPTGFLARPGDPAKKRR